MQPVSLRSPALTGRFFTINATWEQSPTKIESWLRSIASAAFTSSHHPPICDYKTVNVTDWILHKFFQSLSITNFWSLLKLMSIESVMPSNYLILCQPLLPPSVFPSIRVFSNESVLHIRWPKYWSFGFSISPSSEHPGLISFRMDWLDLLVVQVTLKSLLQHHSSKASILCCSAFFTVQLSHPYMTTEPLLAK